MSVYKLSNAGGLKAKTVYTSFLAGNSTYVPPFVPSGAYDSIATTTVGTGGASTITFSSIPQTYKHLQLRILVQGTSSFDSPFLPVQLNGVTAASYAFHRFWGDGSTATYQTSANQNYIVLPRFVDTGNAGYANKFGAMIVDIADYSSTTKTKTILATGGFDSNGAGQIGFNSGLFNNTSAITSITFDTSGVAQYSQFALYGIKGD